MESRAKAGAAIEAAGIAAMAAFFKSKAGATALAVDTTAK